MVFAENRRKPVCRVCGRELRGVTLDCKHEWECSDCATNQEDVLFCEEGCKVITEHIDWGTSSDKEKAAKHLKQGNIYEVMNVHVGRSMSYLVLKEFPSVKFNTVHFIRDSQKARKKEIEQRVAQDIYDIANNIFFGKDYLEYRCNYGSKGAEELLLSNIVDKYLSDRYIKIGRA